MSYDAFISVISVKISQTLVFHIFAFHVHAIEWEIFVINIRYFWCANIEFQAERSCRLSYVRRKKKMLRSLDELEEWKKTRISEWQGEKSYNNMNPKKIKTYPKTKTENRKLKNSNNTHTDSRHDDEIEWNSLCFLFNV